MYPTKPEKKVSEQVFEKTRARDTLGIGEQEELKRISLRFRFLQCVGGCISLGYTESGQRKGREY